jgi:hypothetical protein
MSLSSVTLSHMRHRLSRLSFGAGIDCSMNRSIMHWSFSLYSCGSGRSGITSSAELWHRKARVEFNHALSKYGRGMSGLLSGENETPVMTWYHWRQTWRRLCNCPGRIQTGMDTKTVFAGTALSPELDVLNEILAIISRLPLILVWEHVTGHQDERKKWYKLTRMETLNVRANAHASYALEQQGPASKIITPIPSSNVSLLVHNTTITSHYATHLRKAATRPALLQCFSRHYNWQETTFDSVDWKAHHRAIQKLRFAEKKFVTKFIHQHLPMGLIFHKINPAQSATCSSCQLHTESEAHLLQCPKRCDALEYFLNNTLGNFLEAQHTCPELTWCLRAILESHIRGTEPRFGKQHGRDQPKFLELILAQQAIGWDQPRTWRYCRYSRSSSLYL